MPGRDVVVPSSCAEAKPTEPSRTTATESRFASLDISFSFRRVRMSGPYTRPFAHDKALHPTVSQGASGPSGREGAPPPVVVPTNLWRPLRSVGSQHAALGVSHAGARGDRRPVVPHG